MTLAERLELLETTGDRTTNMPAFWAAYILLRALARNAGWNTRRTTARSGRPKLWFIHDGRRVFYITLPGEKDTFAYRTEVMDLRHAAEEIGILKPKGATTDATR